jgi:hypothetical protein
MQGDGSVECAYQKIEHDAKVYTSNEINLAKDALVEIWRLGGIEALGFRIMSGKERRPFRNRVSLRSQVISGILK